MAIAGEARRARAERTGRVQRAVAILVAMAMLLVPTSPAGSGLLSDLLDDVLDPLRDLLGPILDPILGEVSDALGIPIDQSINELLDGTVDDLIGTAEHLVLPDDGAPLGPPSFEDLAELSLLKPVDPIIEDVLVPRVLGPAGEAIAPIGDLGLPLGDVSTDPIIDVVIGTIRPALEPLSLDPAAYMIQADYDGPDGSTSTVTREALVDIPRAIDITGDGLDDISVELRFLTAQPSLRVTRLPGAPSILPGAVSAILAPQGWSSPRRLAVGFSALDDELPALARVTFTDLGTTTGNVSADIHTVNPADSLDLTASVYDQGAGDTRVEPTDLRVGFSPVPTDATLSAVDALSGFDSGAVSLTASEPTTVDAAVRMGDTAGDSVEVGVVIDKMPGAINLGFALDGTDNVGLDYAASGPVARLAVRLAETTGGVTRSAEIGFEGIDANSATFSFAGSTLGYEASAPIHAITFELVDPTGIVDRATMLRTRLEGLPDTMNVDLGDGSGSTIGFDAGGGVLGLLEIQLSSGPDRAIDPTVDGLILEDVADHYVVSARLTGLRSIVASMNDGFAARLDTVGGRPFVVGIITTSDDGDQSLSARLSALPEQVDVAVGQTDTGTTIDYSASAPVDELIVALDESSGLSARIVVEQLPTALTASITGSDISWSASASVPRLDLDVTDPSGLADRVTDVRVRLVDVPASFTTGLGGGGISLDASPGAIGSLDLLASDGTTEIAVPASVDGLVLTDTPAGFALAARITGVRSATFAPDPLTVGVSTTGPRVFEVDVHQAAADGSSTNVRATIDELPASLTLSLADEDGAPRLDYVASGTVQRLLATVEQTRAAGAGSTTINLEAHGLPTEMTLLLGDSIEYTASAVVPLLRAEVTDSESLVGLANRLLIEVVDIPTAMSFGISDDGELALTTGGGAIGSLETLLTSGPELALPDGIDGILLVDEPNQFVAALRIHGLRSLTFDPSNDASFSLGTLGGRVFEVDLRQQGSDGSLTEVRATLDSLPNDVSVSFGSDGAGGLALSYAASQVMESLRAQLTRTSPDAAPTTSNLEVDLLPTQLELSVSDGGVVSYSASAGVPRLALDIEAPDGIFDRATILRLRAVDLPTRIDAIVDEVGALSITTTGGAIGLIEALITSGPEIGLDGSVDGLVMRDTPDVFAVFARLSGVSGLQFATAEGGATIGLQTTQSRVLELDIATADPDAGTASEIRATLDAMPSSVNLELIDTEDGQTLDYAASGPMNRLFGDIVLTSPEGTNTFRIEVLDLPSTISLDLASGGAITYSASGRVGQLAVTGTNPDGLFLRATTLQALLVDLPPALSVVLGDEGALSLETAGGALGHLDVLATSGPELSPVPGVVGAVIHDTADDFVVALRLDDVSRLAVVADPVAVEVATAGGDVFVIQALFDGGELIDLGDGSVAVEAVIDVLPTDVRLGFGLEGDSQQLAIDASSTINLVTFQLAQTPPGATAPLTADLIIEKVPTHLELSINLSGSVTYSASYAVLALSIDAVDQAGLFDRATQLKLRLEHLPTGLDIAISETGAVMIDTTGGKLGLMEAQATTGPDNRVPAGWDGILFEDLVDRFVVFARFSNLYSGDVAQVPQPRVRLQSDGGRPLSLGLYESAPGKPSRIPNVAFTEATLQNLPASVDLELLDGAPGTINIAYEASSTASNLTLETNAGDRWVTQASLSNPVPQWFTACQAGDGRCVASGQSTANVGSFRFLASQHTTLNVLDCARPLNSNCTRANGNQLTNIQNMRIRSFGFEGNFTDCGLLGQQACGHLWADTLPDGVAANLANAHTLQGQIFNKDGSTELTLNFGANFRAAKRKVVFSRFPSIWPWTLQTTKTGAVSCTSGTSLNIRVQLIFTLNFNGNSLLC